MQILASGLDLDSIVNLDVLRIVPYSFHQIVSVVEVSGSSSYSHFQ